MDDCVHIWWKYNNGVRFTVTHLSPDRTSRAVTHQSRIRDPAPVSKTTGEIVKSSNTGGVTSSWAVALIGINRKNTNILKLLQNFFLLQIMFFWFSHQSPFNRKKAKPPSLEIWKYVWYGISSSLRYLRFGNLLDQHRWVRGKCRITGSNCCTASDGFNKPFGNYFVQVWRCYFTAILIRMALRGWKISFEKPKYGLMGQKSMVLVI
jgi:hypothetical protein